VVYTIKDLSFSVVFLFVSLGRAETNVPLEEVGARLDQGAAQHATMPKAKTRRKSHPKKTMVPVMCCRFMFWR
jgi:hypothetical protein